MELLFMKRSIVIMAPLFHCRSCYTESLNIPKCVSDCHISPCFVIAFCEDGGGGEKSSELFIRCNKIDQKFSIYFFNIDLILPFKLS